MADVRVLIISTDPVVAAATGTGTMPALMPSIGLIPASEA
jgi:hypothetical protein